MQVNVEQLDPCKVALNIEVAADAVAQTIDDVYREFALRTEVPGFRKGKTPRRILEKYVSPESVRKRVVDLMVARAYPEALEQSGIQPYAEPDLEIVQLDEERPFIFKAVVPLPPTVELGEYRGIEVERAQVQVTDQHVEAQLKYLQETRATSEKIIDRGIQIGDFVIMELASAAESEEMGPPRRTVVEIGANIPDFDSNVLGLKPGEQRTFAAEYPSDYGDTDLAGRKVGFNIKVEAIRERRVPELNDEFARSLGDFADLGELHEDVRARLESAHSDEADKEVKRKLVEEIVSRSKILFPDVMVDHEVRHDLDEIRGRLDKESLSFEQYLAQIGKTREQLVAELGEAAAKRIRAGLVLGAVADKEKMDVTEQEVESEIERMAAESNATKEAVEAYLEVRGGHQSLRNSLLNKRILDFLMSVSTVNSREVASEST